MKIRLLALTAVVALAAACATTPKTAAPAAPAKPAAPAVAQVAGKWLLTIESQMGPQDTNVVLTQTGADIAGTLEMPMGSANLKGSVTASDIKITFPFSAQGTELQIDFIGKTDGQTMSGQAVFGSFGEGTFKAKRAP